MSRIDVTASGSPITVTASDSQINATVGPAPSFTVDVSGGQGPQGPAGPQGEPGDDAALPPGTEGYVLTYVGGEWVAAEPSGGGGGVPSAHASSHQPGGHDELYNQSLNTTDVPTFDGLVIAGTFPALQIAETVGLYYDSTAGYWLLDCGDEEHQGVISRFSLMNCEEIAFLDESVQTTAWTGAVAAESVTGLATVATTGSYDDLDDLPAAPITYARLSDTVSNVSYIGLAPSGSATSESVWRIKRTTIATGGTVSASVTATNVAWTDRLTATYS